MSFISLGEALDRVLEKLAVERREKEAGGVKTARQVGAGVRGGAAPALARGSSAALGAPSNRDKPGRAARRSAVEIYGYEPDHGLEKPGCDVGCQPIALRQRQGTQTHAGTRRPVGGRVRG